MLGLDPLGEFARVAVGVGLGWPAVASQALGHAVGGVVPDAAVPRVRRVGRGRVDVHGVVLSVAVARFGRPCLGRRVPAVRCVSVRVPVPGSDCGGLDVRAWFVWVSGCGGGLVGDRLEVGFWAYAPAVAALMAVRDGGVDAG